MRIAVLGAGPAGLFAVHAAITRHQVDLFSLGFKSQLYGAQYLHEPIPGLITKVGRIRYELRGTTEQYREKVYGPGQNDLSVSPERYLGASRAFDIRLAYDDAWKLYSRRIQKAWVDDLWVRNHLDLYDLIISTVPAHNICLDREWHNFHVRQAYAIGDAPELDARCPVTVPEGSVVCNGEDDPAWYRASNIFGYRTAEWPYFAKASDVPANATLIAKPLKTDCDCWGGKVLRLGRYGAWSKDELSHMAYYRTKEYLDEEKPS